MQSRTRALAFTIGLLALFLAVGAVGVYAQRIKHVTYDPGDVIPVKLDKELSSVHSRTGDRFTATVDSSEKGYEFLRGAKIEGKVTSARRKEKDRPGLLGVTFTRMRTSSGKAFDIRGSLFALDNKDVDRRSDGVLVAKKGEEKKTLEYAGIGAAGGALVGLLGNGKLNLGSTVVGGALGAGAAQIAKGKPVDRDVTLSSGTKIGVRIDRRFEYRAD